MFIISIYQVLLLNLHAESSVYAYDISYRSSSRGLQKIGSDFSVLGCSPTEEALIWLNASWNQTLTQRPVEQEMAHLGVNVADVESCLLQ